MMKLWRNILVMTAAMLSLASCSSDDDSNVYEAAELGGTWQKVYDEGVADSVRSLPITAPLRYSPPTGHQATLQFIAFTPLPTLGICIFLPSPMTPQLPSLWIATSTASPARR